MSGWVIGGAIAVGVLIVVGGVYVAAQPNNEEWKVGDRVPDLTVKASDGKTYRLREFEGKKAVVIAWFPKAFTGG